jgi:hypothetical protein
MTDTAQSEEETGAASPGVGAFAGGALGLLVGLLLGLSVSNVVGSVLGPLTALLGAFFGLSGGAGRLAPAAPLRLAAFGLLCALGVAAGVAIRAGDLLAPSPAESVARWTAAGFAPERAQALAVYERLGLAPPGAQPAPETMAARGRSSALFAGEAGAACGRLDQPIYADAAALAAAMRDEGGAWEAFARDLPPTLAGPARLAALEAGVRLVCR